MNTLMIRNLFISLLATALLSCQNREVFPPAPYGATPNEAQLQWHEVDFYGIIHLSLNTYTDKEWGYGDESVKLFNPYRFDAKTIVSAMKEAGMKGVLLVAKHHCGFCLWPTSTTDYSVKNSPWRKGKGDMVREFADAAREAGLKFGVYNSPWDRNDADYGKPEYIQRYREQLRELHTNYGDIFISWYDGANGGDGYYGGAREMRKLDLENYYDWDSTFVMVRRWQPLAAIFNFKDIRWVGNERGFAGDPCWETYDPAPEGSATWNPTNGQRNGQCWMPAECDVPLRPGWFYHKSENERTKTPEQLFDLYFRSVGRGQAFDVGLAPDTKGQLHPNDIRSLKGLGDLLKQTFTKNYAEDASVSVNQTRGKSGDFSASHLTDNDKQSYWSTDDDTTEGEIILEWKQPQTFNIISIREYLPLGQRIDSAVVETLSGKQWTLFAKATSIGANRLLRCEPVKTAKLRIRTYGPVCPAVSEIGVYREPERIILPVETNNTTGLDKLSKTGWNIVSDSTDRRVFDEDVSTVWHTKGKQELCIDLGRETVVSAFVYTPPVTGSAGLVSKYELYISDSPVQWGKAVAGGEFGNIRNNPLPQTIQFLEPVKGRYIRFAAPATIDDAPMTAAEVDVFCKK
ncbi:MAG: alpha-L-fucosidase [Prevotella sp.]|jgi:alpha-L-fucosidase|nr:alpha-L-fucosidase [Prevotella sp.]